MEQEQGAAFCLSESGHGKNMLLNLESRNSFFLAEASHKCYPIFPVCGF